jgi:hypothetical protein
MMDAETWLSFTARLDKEGINPCVSVPAGISQTFAVRGYVPVVLKLKLKKFQANLVPLGGGRHRLYINGPMLQATGWRVGDKVSIQLHYDAKPRITPMSLALSKQLKKHPKAKRIFDDLPPSRQKEINRYLNNLKSPDALQKNVVQVISALEGNSTHMLVR